MTSETRLVSLILARLRKLENDGSPCHFWRANTGKVASHSGRWVSFGEKGQADILGVFDAGLGIGRFVAIEVKTETGKQSDDQLKWQGKIENAGGIYILARSWDDVARALGL